MGQNVKKESASPMQVTIIQTSLSDAEETVSSQICEWIMFLENSPS
jgi:hypothetical protein